MLDQSIFLIGFKTQVWPAKIRYMHGCSCVPSGPLGTARLWSLTMTCIRTYINSKVDTQRVREWKRFLSVKEWVYHSDCVYVISEMTYTQSLWSPSLSVTLHSMPSDPGSRKTWVLKMQNAHQRTTYPRWPWALELDKSNLSKAQLCCIIRSLTLDIFTYLSLSFFTSKMEIIGPNLQGYYEGTTS